MPTWLTEIEGPRPLAELERTTSAHAARRRGVRRRREPAAARRVDSLVQEQPERVAQQLRAWISEDPE